MNESFLLRFQEHHNAPEIANMECGTKTITESRETQDQDPDALAAGTQTKSSGREQPDQDFSSISNGTKTITAVRSEQSDEDVGVASYRAIPLTKRKVALGTETVTKVREDRDQDASVLSMGTKTSTATREESDQDASPRNYLALPISPR